MGWSYTSTYPLCLHRHVTGRPLSLISFWAIQNAMKKNSITFNFNHSEAKTENSYYFPETELGR
jgi:hypothetical protein